MKKSFYFASLLILFVFITTSGCGRNEERLSGTWEREDIDFAWHSGENTVITFSGNNFVMYTYSSAYWAFGDWPPEIVPGQPMDGEVRVTVDGRDLFRYREAGTFSISSDQSGNRVEFVFSNSDIRVYNFTRTDNTLMLGGRRFYRR